MVRVFEEEEVRVRIFALIPYYHVRILEEIFILLLMWTMLQVYRHHNYMIRKPLILIQLLLII